MRPATLAIAMAAVLACAAARAERADREKEMVVNADRLTADDANRLTTFEGAVVVTQGTMRITAARVTVREDAKRNKFYIASGAPVTFRQKRDNLDEYVEGSADRAEFDDSTDVLKLFNKARVKSNQNELTGDFISYDMRRELAEVSGAPPGQPVPASTGRVKMIIIPQKKATDADAKQDGAPGVSLKPDAGKP